MKLLLNRLFGKNITEKFCRFYQKELQLFRSILGTSAKK